ncbi:beta-carotene 15,15'-monooxygenase [Paenibacillus sp. BSR1-1]|uniref:beta-carotene 15,15'-monooxygenase n=1 Tax=Paenibacillus sp. BSR1-1 TaxID=3020845 RepID=UPI0025B036BA|nr:beta-carotene 15,15'-monooxygenase [Paenibacillus sp. BSR1-1]MDN3016117.1 beta-carotene 15,15'-monooxygenase [Paenibacillus sp. BSR1-1]
MVLKRASSPNVLPILLLLVLSANYSLYHTTLGIQLLPDQPNLVVVASMIDLALISPILFLAWIRKLNWKNLIFGIAGGLIFVSFYIPKEYLAPFKSVTWLGFAVEGSLFLLEILVLFSLFKFLPSIVRSVKSSPLPVLYSFSNAVENQVKSYPIIRIICSEMLMFYFAFAAWRKKPQQDTNMFTLHQKSSLMAIRVMLIHATVIEMAGLHWIFHEKSMILSIVLLVINIYTVFFFVADLQAVRLNPLVITEEKMYISLGLLKRIEIKWSEVEKIIDNPQQLIQKQSKDTIEFMARDFEEVHPNVILKLKKPIEATLIMGMKKEFSRVAIKVDDPNQFKEVLRKKYELN